MHQILRKQIMKSLESQTMINVTSTNTYRPSLLSFEAYLISIYEYQSKPTVKQIKSKTQSQKVTHLST